MIEDSLVATVEAHNVHLINVTGRHSLNLFVIDGKIEILQSITFAQPSKQGTIRQLIQEILPIDPSIIPLQQHEINMRIGYQMMVPKAVSSTHSTRGKSESHLSPEIRMTL